MKAIFMSYEQMVSKAIDYTIRNSDTGDIIDGYIEALVDKEGSEELLQKRVLQHNGLATVGPESKKWVFEHLACY